MKKILVLLFICIVYLMACVGIVSAEQTIVETPESTPNPQPTGYIPGYWYPIHVYCNVEGASVDYKHGMGNMGGIGGSAISHHVIKNGYAGFSGSTSMDFISINVSADGYIPQTITDVTIPEPGETLELTVNLKPIASKSPAPTLGIIIGLCTAASLLLMKRKI